MLAISIGKMLKNKWIYLCLLLACVFSVALIASVPAYENAIKKRMFQRELTALQHENGRPPLVHTVNVDSSYIIEYDDGSIAAYRMLIYNNTLSRLQMPIDSQQLTLTSPNSPIFHISPYGEIAAAGRTSIIYTSDFFNHVELVAGRFPNNLEEPQAIEVVISEAAAVRASLMLDSKYWQSYEVRGIRGDAPDRGIYFRIVGIVRMIDPGDPFWINPLAERDLYTTYESFMKTIQAGESGRFAARWVTIFDHTNLQPENIYPILEAMRERGSGILTNINVLREANEREVEFGTFLWVLMAPNLSLLIFFIIMMSGLVLDHDKVEISLLYSRGAGKGRILAMYAIQTFILAGIATVIGIPLSLLLCTILGASAGFLEFAGRAPLNVTLTPEVFLYAISGSFLFVSSMLIPILFSKSTSIVAHRRAKAARGTKPFFERYYLDLILIFISLYGYFAYQNLSDILTYTDAEVAEFAIDPLIFLISTFFLMGCAMLFTRLYPYIIRIMFRLGRSIWPPAIYASLSAARSRPRSRYIMLFIMMTVSIGLYAAAAARTINQNYLDRTMYEVGADLIIQERWPFIDPNPQFIGLYYVIPHVKDAFFTEMPFELFNQPEGVALATKVYRNDRAGVARGSDRLRVNNVNVMAIYPDEFAKVSWWREDMYHYHLNYKMNAMSVNPHVVLLSRSLMEALNVSHGDEVTVQWANNDTIVTCFVYDAVDFFPTFNPVNPDGTPAYLIVMNYELVKTEFRIEPYEVWIMKEEGASSSDIVQFLSDNRVVEPMILHNIDRYAPQFRVTDSQVRLAAVRNDPLILSMNGFLTLSFVMTLAITAVGFLVFWIFDLRSRRLQISIMRSAGMPQSAVIAMLLWEQVLLSILPLTIGFLLGGIGASMFVPMFEMGGADSPLPFLVFRLAADSMRVGVIVSSIILIAIAMLWYMAARIKISQTLKLGEE